MASIGLKCNIIKDALIIGWLPMAFYVGQKILWRYRRGGKWRYGRIMGIDKDKKSILYGIEEYGSWAYIDFEALCSGNATKESECIKRSYSWQFRVWLRKNNIKCIMR